MSLIRQSNRKVQIMSTSLNHTSQVNHTSPVNYTSPLGGGGGQGRSHGTLVCPPGGAGPQRSVVSELPPLAVINHGNHDNEGPADEDGGRVSGEKQTHHDVMDSGKVHCFPSAGLGFTPQSRPSPPSPTPLPPHYSHPAPTSPPLPQLGCKWDGKLVSQQSGRLGRRVGGGRMAKARDEQRMVGPGVGGGGGGLRV